MFNKKRVLSVVLAALMLVSCLTVLGACKKGSGSSGPAKLERDPNGEYTYNTYLSTFPTVWNNHTYQTATDGEILGYTEPGFYTFDYNENKDGYVLVPEMATKDPIDVTADYIGEEWGIAEGDTAKAWKIVLRSDIKWEDGTPITAQDFVDSAKLLLNPVAGNYRADSLYTGNMIIVNAENYFKQGKVVDEDNGLTGAYAIADLVKGDDGVYKTANGEPVYIALNSALDWLSGKTLTYYVEGYGDAYFDVASFDALKALADEETGYVVLNETTLAHLVKLITTVADWGETADDAANYLYYTKTYGDMEFDKVGIKAVSDTELVLIMQNPLEGFYLLYSLTGAWLVKEDLYEANTKIEDGVYYNTYGTSASTYMSYGPYKLASFEQDKRIVLVRNDKWYGYNDEANKDYYWTTKIVYDYIENPETAMQAFLKGELDSKGLDVDQMEVYGKSEHIYYTDGASTFFIAVNPNLDALKSEQEAAGDNINKTILTLKEFRMALSFALDRKSFNLACDPTASSGFAVFNNLIISDPETGTSYRSTEEAKKVLVEFWGLTDEIGEGKMYADMDEAIDSITGYNLDLGKQYFDAAYDKAIAEGLMDADDKIEICIGIPSAQAKFYVNGYDFLVNCYTKAVEGTKLEGKLTFTKDDTVGNGFANALRANTVDLLFGVGWQGAALDPYYLMTAYTMPNYQYDPAWDTSAEQLEITIDGVAYTASVLDWTMAMNGETIRITPVAGGDSVDYSCGLADKKPAERLTLLAALEGAILANYNLLPINNESSAALKGFQIKYGTENYVYGVGRGGVKYMQYYYTDAEWAEFVADNSVNGELNYK